MKPTSQLLTKDFTGVLDGHVRMSDVSHLRGSIQEILGVALSHTHLDRDDSLRASIAQTALDIQKMVRPALPASAHSGLARNVETIIQRFVSYFIRHDSHDSPQPNNVDMRSVEMMRHVLAPLRLDWEEPISLALDGDRPDATLVVSGQMLLEALHSRNLFDERDTMGTNDHLVTGGTPKKWFFRQQQRPRKEWPSNPEVHPSRKYRDWHSSDQKLRDFRPPYLTKSIIIREYLNLGKISRFYFPNRNDSNEIVISCPNSSTLV